MNNIAKLLLTASALSIAVTANADPGHGKSKLEFDQHVTPMIGGNLIFGGGNANGFFTTGRKNGVEVGLRAKVRFPTPANPDNTISNGDGTYNLPAGAKTTDFSDRVTSLWSFDWTVNTDYLGVSGTGKKLSDFVYELGMDGDPSSKASYTSFDPISTSLLVPCWDHAMGDNNTMEAPSPADKNVSDCVDYADDLELSNVAQQSWRYNWYVALGTSLEHFDPSVPGEYTIYLKVLDPKGKGKKGKGKKGKVVAESKIVVLVTAP